MRQALVALLFFSIAADLSAQSDRMRLIDSIANPELSATGVAMKFDTPVMDVGTIAEEAMPPQFEFFWTNEGDKPVTILKVTTSCGCAVPSFDSRPVGPGEKSSLKITYYPKGHPGTFHRRIFVYTDLSGSRPAAALSLKGDVRPADKPVWMYQYRMGSLCLKQKEIHFTEEKRTVERIVCMNAGDEPLTIGVSEELLPPFLGFRCEPRTIPPAGLADIVVTYDPEAVPMRLANVVPLVLTGPDVPPSQRTIMVIFEDGKTEKQK